MTTPRILPATADELTPETVARIEASSVPGSDSSNAFWTLGRHERLFKGYLSFALRIFQGTLPARDREIVILRTAILCRSDYEWGQHWNVATQLQVLSLEEIDHLVDPDWHGWSVHERALFQALDELHRDARLQDGTWDTLALSYDDAQLVELLMLIGFYQMLAYTVNTVGIELERDDYKRLPAEVSAPMTGA